MLRPSRTYIVVLFAILAAVLAKGAPGSGAAQEPDDWVSNWAVRSGFSIQLILEGLQYPTAMAFVPDPGPDLSDPAYFVTELGGTIKVVTVGGELLTFAENFFSRVGDDVYPPGGGQTGLSGICLAPDQGYVFVTYAYAHEDGSIRNNIGRFETVPRVFATSPTAFQDFKRVFIGDESRESHQIGSCQVHDGNLYVGVADGGRAQRSTDLDSTLGKVLRMTLDGLPTPDNPFYEDQSQLKPRNYAWASGLRNPFGLRVAEGRLFVADNGLGVDRFLRIEAGRSYLWNGSDDSIAAAADLLVLDGRGVAQFDHYQADLGFFPEDLADSFFLVVSGDPIRAQRPPAILSFQYSFDEERVVSPPVPFLEYLGVSNQVLAFASSSHGGLYFAPLIPGEDGIGRLFRIVYSPLQRYPNLILSGTDPRRILSERGCLGCHSLDQEQANTVGPSLEPSMLVERLRTRLNSAEYEQSLEAVDQLSREPFESYREARTEVMQAVGLDRVRAWLTYQLQEPRFDNPDSQMPAPELSDLEVVELVDFFLEEAQARTPEEGEATGESGDSTIVARIANLLPNPVGRRHLAYAGIAGVVVGWATLAGAYLLVHFRRRT